MLQEGEFERVGGSRTLKVDVRLVDRDEPQSGGSGREGRHSERICTIDWRWCRSSCRRCGTGPGDIPLLAHEFLRRYNADNNTRVHDDVLGDAGAAVLLLPRQRAGTGELRAADRDAVAGRPDLRKRLCLSQRWLPVGGAVETDASADSVHAACALPDRSCLRRRPRHARCRTNRTAGQSEYEQLVDAMERSGWVQAKAARLLNMTPRQIGYALRKHDIPIKKF